MAEGRQLLIQGKVQGVFFRAWAVETACALGLRGWVRNLRDGRVELLAWGDRDALDRLTERCRTGPPAARVEAIAVQPATEPEVAGFEKRPTV